ncbi:MAG: STAS-like domain-containing protein [Massilia sp.]
MQNVSVARDFTRFPSGRFKKNGDTSGEAFRERFLEPALRDGIEITVDLDGTIGYGSSFLEEAFGGLVRALHVTPDYVYSKLCLRSTDPALLDEVKSYINDAGRREN